MVEYLKDKRRKAMRICRQVLTRRDVDDMIKGEFSKLPRWHKMKDSDASAKALFKSTDY
jgi:hypothetical protein